MNAQIRAAALRLALTQAGIIVAPNATFYTGDVAVLGKLAGMRQIPKYSVDLHDEELGIVQVSFDLLEEAYFEAVGP